MQVGAASQSAYGFSATSGQGAPATGMSSMMQNTNNASRGLGGSASSASMYRTERTNAQGTAPGNYEEMMGNNDNNQRTMGRESSFGGGPPGAQRDWMNFKGPPGQTVGGGGMMDRPMTASQNNQRLRELENELRNEKRTQKRLTDEIANLKMEINKSNFSTFVSNQREVSVTAGRLPMVPGVREIKIDDLEIGQQIG